METVTSINTIISRLNNQYFFNELVGVYCIQLTDKILLFDLPTYSPLTERYILSFKKPVISILSHGSCGIADGTLWQSKGIKIYLHQNDKNSEWLRMEPTMLFDRPPFIDKNIEIIFTPGHSPGSICVLEKKTKSLFTGDTVGGDEAGNIYNFYERDGNGDLDQRFKSCISLLEYNFESILPFHYNMIQNNAKIALKNFISMYNKKL